ncbi:MAG TPA: alpha/beta hydrolase [Sphingomonas sp.]
MRLLFLHGWGLDSTLWDGVRAALPEHEAVAWDRGYFGSASAEPAEEPVLAVGHSLGAMLLAGMKGIAGLVAVNGFDRFVGENAVPPRVVARMRRRFAEAPEEVLADFRNRIGAPPAPAHIEPEALAADLALLAQTGPQPSAGRRMLVLHGGADPLLPEPMRGAVFAGAPRETLANAGHLLPLTHPAWVADRIRAFAA